MPENSASRPTGPIDRELYRLAAGPLLVAFQGTTVPEWVLAETERGLGGVTLFGFNVADPAQLSALTGRLREAGDLVISLDEEGGDVTRLAYHTGSPYPGNAALGAVDDVGLTREVYHAIAGELALCGINLNMAPDADVNTADDNPVIGTRAFGNDPTLVARHTVAAVEGLQAAGVAACVKHFPGHGATLQDSHLEIPLVDAGLDVLRARELVPFRAAIGAGARSVMTAHVRVPVLTGEAPATLSSAALTGLLREELGFAGVIVSDALDMRAITDAYGLAGGAVMSLAAGADLLCLGPLPTYDDVRAVIAGIAQAAQDGRLPVERLAESAARVAALHAWFAEPRPAVPGGQVIGLAAARRALSLTGTPPAPVDPLVVELETPPTIAVGEVPWGFAPWLQAAEVVRVTPGQEEPESLLERAKDRSLVIVTKDAHRHESSRALMAALVAARPDAAVVEMGLPVWRPDSAVYIATYGAARPNARAAAELLFPDLVKAATTS
ncbi:glycoside hydrolase [Spongiactinospora gelatinilytica]|uniref:Glycoside hydrolase n=1 Tax=Spongiactinospora gelatinilytica TaxID=2666298 RepID=A0A2W2I1G3_9ACTN|nr:glycoside hydrolase family 3 N-terminal domain-containing protein [Spongiactinospora gelatinilytica]PZG56740.1 glycoside hydrolase [Spongiactinospora gelatinilytica]